MTFSYGIAGILASLTAAALLIGGCAIQSARPLMSAWDEDAGFGYSERKIETSGPNVTWEVTYIGPFLRTHLKPSDRVGDIKRLRALANDMAHWRAADLAVAGNYAGLKIIEKSGDITVETFQGDPRIVRYGLAHGQSGYRYVQSRAPGFKSAWLRAKSVIVVILKKKAGAGDLDAAATADRMARKHHGARILPAY